MEDDVDSAMEFAYGDIQRTSFRPARPTKYKTFEDVFRWDLYQQSKDVPGGMYTIFPPLLIQECILMLTGHHKLQLYANPGALVLGYEYYKRVQARDLSPDILKELFERALKIDIKPFDIVRYNRLWFQLLQGDNKLQPNPSPYRITESLSDPSKVQIEMVPPHKIDVPPFQSTIPSTDPAIEGSMTIHVEQLPGNTISYELPIYAFDTLEQILRTVAYQLKVPLSLLRYSHTVSSAARSLSKVKDIHIFPGLSDKERVIGVEIEEETIAEPSLVTSTSHPYHRSTLSVRPITYYTLDESLTTIQAIDALQTFLKEQQIGGILSKALSASYFILFGLLSPDELYSDSYRSDQLWNAFLQSKDSPWIDIPAEGRDTRLAQVLRQKIQLSQELTLDTSKQLKLLLEQERTLRDEILTKSIFVSTRDLLRQQYQSEQQARLAFLASSRQMSYLLTTPKRLKITDLKDTKYIIEGTFTMEGYDSYELFNQMQVSMEIPFCTVGKFHKVLNGIELPKHWIQDQENEDVVFYIRTRTLPQQMYSILQVDDIYPELYTKVAISTLGSKKVIIATREAYITSFKVLIEAENSVDQYNVLQKFLSSFQSPPLDLKVRKLFGEGEYVLVGLSFSAEILHDYAFNDPLVREFIHMNEHSRLYTIRLRYKFYLGEELEGFIRSSVVEKAVDPAIRFFPTDVKVGDTIHTVSLRRQKEISVKEVQLRKRYFDACLQYIVDTYMSRFISWYSRHIVNIRDITSITESKTKLITKQLTNRLVNPGLFRSGYTRACSHTPIIVSEEEARRIKDVLQFPKPIDITDERPQFWYKCPDPIYKFPSLKVNTLSFKDKKETEHYHQLYPFIPCCLELNQNVEGTLLDNYIRNPSNTLDTPFFPGKRDEESRSKSVLQQKTALRPKQLGELPRVIRDLLITQQKDLLLGKYDIVRYGIPASRQGTSFFTACCAAAFFPELQKTSNFRAELAKKEQLLANQLLQRITTHQIPQVGKLPHELRYILQTHQFVNPKDWILLVQDILKINILIAYYDRTEEDQDIGYFLTPNYDRFYLLSSPSILPYSNTILLYNAPDSLSYLPRHSEPIVIVQQHKVITFQFPTSPHFQHLLDHTMVQIPFSLPSLDTLQPLWQKTDTYGKIREVILRHPTHGSVHFHCSPIPPLTIQNDALKNGFPKPILTQTPQTIVAILQTLQASIYYIANPRDPRQVIGLIGKTTHSDSSLPFTLWYAEFIHSVALTDLPGIPLWNLHCNSYLAPVPDSSRTSSGKPVTHPEETFFEKYSNFTRQSNCLLSYLYFLFSSLFYQEDDLPEAARLFETRHFYIRPQHHYQIKDRTLYLEQSQFIHQSSQLIVPSEIIRERLMYNLRLQIEYNESFLRDYRLKKYIPNFYNNAKDFYAGDLFAIYYTAAEYQASRSKQKMIYHVFSTPSTQLVSFYFKHTQILDEQLCIARRIDSDQEKIDAFGFQQPFTLYTLRTQARGGQHTVTQQTVQLLLSESQILQLIPADIPVPSSQPALLLFKEHDQPYTFLLQKYDLFSSCQ